LTEESFCEVWKLSGPTIKVEKETNRTGREEGGRSSESLISPEREKALSQKKRTDMMQENDLKTRRKQKKNGTSEWAGGGLWRGKGGVLENQRNRAKVRRKERSKLSQKRREAVLKTGDATFKRRDSQKVLESKNCLENCQD